MERAIEHTVGQLHVVGVAIAQRGLKVFVLTSISATSTTGVAYAFFLFVILVLF